MLVLGGIFRYTQRQLYFMLTDTMFLLKTVLFWTFVLNGFYREQVNMPFKYEVALVISIETFFGNVNWRNTVPVFGLLLDILSVGMWALFGTCAYVVVTYIPPYFQWIQKWLVREIWRFMCWKVVLTYVGYVMQTLARNHNRRYQ